MSHFTRQHCDKRRWRVGYIYIYIVIWWRILGMYSNSCVYSAFFSIAFSFITTSMDQIPIGTRPLFGRTLSSIGIRPICDRDHCRNHTEFQLQFDRNPSVIRWHQYLLGSEIDYNVIHDRHWRNRLPITHQKHKHSRERRLEYHDFIYIYG